jgi:2-keto-3-deoxy-L-rhamnonate aldolase RhmA
MIDLLQITNDPALAARCDALPGMRVFLDLERTGKAERQAGRSTFISTHQVEDIAPVRAVLRHSRLMVRVNPLHPATKNEVDGVIGQGADLIMLPMFQTADELQAFSRIVDGRCPIVPLVETRGALESVADWISTPGLWEVFVGLNDLHMSLGCRFMFEPLAQGLVETMAVHAHAAGLRFGFGGIARLQEGQLPGRDVLAEHLRLGSDAVILSRTFHRSDASTSFEDEVAAMRRAEVLLAARSAAEIEADQVRIAESIRRIALGVV